MRAIPRTATEGQSPFPLLLYYLCPLVSFLAVSPFLLLWVRIPSLSFPLTHLLPLCPLSQSHSLIALSPSLFLTHSSGSPPNIHSTSPPDTLHPHSFPFSLSSICTFMSFHSFRLNSWNSFWKNKLRQEISDF